MRPSLAHGTEYRKSRNLAADRSRCRDCSQAVAHPLYDCAGAGGAALAVSPFAPEINLSKELIFTIFLPPLIYEAALYIRWRELSQNLPVILAFAIAGVLISTALTAIGMHWLIGWPWQSAILFGALIAATDPVSVIATFVWLLRPYQTDKDLLPSKKKNRPIQKLDSKPRMGTLVEYRTI